MTTATTTLELPSAPGPRPALGAYVHIPFCIVRCGYCDFNAYAGMDHMAPAYVDALVSQIQHSSDGRTLNTVFFGGGTPTQLSPGQLGRIVDALRDGFCFAPDIEITVEANPESVDGSIFEQLLAVGFNRVSIGIQSTSPQVLQFLGRVHSVERGLGALTAARSAGFKRINADLIFGSPGESDQAWSRSLEQVIACDVDHVSAYALTVEEGTPLHSWVSHKQVPAPDEDELADRYQIASEMLSEAGFSRYETSNWAKDGSWCRHNLVYWRGEDYLGFGAGAHGHRQGDRFWQVRSPQAYIERSPETVAGSETLTLEQRIEEAAILGLRLAGGLDRARFREVWGVDLVEQYGQQLAALGSRGLVECSAEKVTPTSKGFFLGSEAAIALMS